MKNFTENKCFSKVNSGSWQGVYDVTNELSGAHLLMMKFYDLEDMQARKECIEALRERVKQLEESAWKLDQGLKMAIMASLG